MVAASKGSTVDVSLLVKAGASLDIQNKVDIIHTQQWCVIHTCQVLLLLVILF